MRSGWLERSKAGELPAGFLIEQHRTVFTAAREYRMQVVMKRNVIRRRLIEPKSSDGDTDLRDGGVQCVDGPLLITKTFPGTSGGSARPIWGRARVCLLRPFTDC